MKFPRALLAPLLLASLVWAAPAQSRSSSPSSARASACEQEWQAMAQRHREQADAMLKESSGLRAMLTMLRNDAGIVRDATVRDGLQVSADMWESLLTGLQSQAAGLQALAQQEESKRHALCLSAEK
jgi:membrane protease subunit (stomatin/prohibitin family)